MPIAHANAWEFGWTPLTAIITLVFTAVAVGVALWVAVCDSRRLASLQEQVAEDQKLEQASRVSAWATSETEHPGVPKSAIVGNPWFARVHVLNGSVAAIYDVVVRIGHRALTEHWFDLGVKHEWSVLPPGSEVHADFVQGHVRNFSAPHNTLLCVVAFRDSRGVRWTRDAAGYLTEVAASAVDE